MCNLEPPTRVHTRVPAPLRIKCHRICNGRRCAGSHSMTGATVNTEEALLVHLLSTACHAAWFLTGHRLTLGGETPVLDNRQNYSVMNSV